MTAEKKSENRHSRADFVATFNDPLEDWQVAGLAFLLFKGGLYWGAGSYANEGKANLKQFSDAAQAANKKSLRAYIDNVATALDNSVALQAQAANVHAAIKDLISNMTTASPWTYCGDLEPAALTGMVKSQ